MDADEDDAEGPRPFVWGIWKKQSLEHIRDVADTVLEQNKGLIGLFLRKTKLPPNAAFTHEDLHNVYRVVLLQAYASYDPSRGAFSTWAHLWLNQAAMDVVRRVVGRTRPEQSAYIRALREKRQENDLAAGRTPVTTQEPLTDRERDALAASVYRQFISLQASRGQKTKTSEDRTLEETLRVDREDAVEAEEQIDEDRARRWLYAKLGNGVLTERERTVMQGTLQGWSFTQIGRMLGVSRQCVDVHHKKAVEKLRRAAERDGL